MESNNAHQAIAIVNKMYEADLFSQWLGIELIEVLPGLVKIAMTVRPEMCNGFGIAHGGISYSLADSALAFASNGHGNLCMSIETSISHTKPIVIGDRITASAVERNRSKSIGIYDITVTNQHEKLVALFKGTVFIKDQKWEV